jgi:septum formation protein
MPALDLILASTSIYRQELLTRLRIPFTALAPEVDESSRAEETPLARAQRLALEKAQAVAERCPDSFVIGSDQVALCKGQLLGKPATAERCREQLQLLSGAAATFHTAVAIVCAQRAVTQQFVDTTTAYFRSLSEPEIERYIEKEQPFDCAGGFRCEGLGIALFSRVVCEDPTGLIGLPLIGVSRVLRQAGFEVP